MRLMIRATTAALLLALIACGFSSSSKVNPTAPGAAVSLDTFVGTWTSTTGSTSTASLPNSCNSEQYNISKAAGGQSASVTFSAVCAGMTIAGTGAGTLAGSTLTWSLDGTISREGTQVCAFDFKDNTATPEGTDAIRVNYSGTVCGVTVAGSQLVHRKP